jgi:hypothetical protein
MHPPNICAENLTPGEPRCGIFSTFYGYAHFLSLPEAEVGMRVHFLVESQSDQVTQSSARNWRRRPPVAKDPGMMGIPCKSLDGSRVPMKLPEQCVPIMASDGTGSGWNAASSTPCIVALS